MSTYTLELLIDSQDLRVLKGAQQRIILAKPVGGASPTVAWQSFDPFETNAVTWTEEYGLYASNTTLASGAIITKMSSINPPALDAAYYSFAADATFHGPNQSGDVPGLGAYRIFNDMPDAQYPSLVFGLMQSAIINNVDANFRPLNAQMVPANQKATFTPLTVVYIWLQSSLISGTVITEVTSKHAQVTFGGSTSLLSLRYDPSRGMFVPFSPETDEFILDAPHVKLLNPAIT